MAIDPTKNISKKLPAFPYDENRKPVAPMLAATVAAGEVNGYLPIKAIDNGDGTASLALTTVVDPDIDIGDVHLLDLTDTKINPATKEKQDAIITAINAIAAGVDPVGLKNIAASPINPATEDTLATRASEATLALLEAKDFATQTTLALVATEATLAAIKVQTDKLIFTGDDLNVVDSTAAATAGVAEHHNGTATTTPATVAFSGTSKSLLIDNLDASKNLLVSFDAGANTKTVAPGQSLSIEANHASVDVSAASGTVAFEMLVTV